MSQNKDLLRYLKMHRKGITALKAYEKFGIMRLSARILDLKNSGHKIESKMIVVKNRRGESCRVSNYKLSIYK